MTKSGIEEQRASYRKYFPYLAKAMLDERDLFMTQELHKIFERESPAKFSGKFYLSLEFVHIVFTKVARHRLCALQA